MLQIACGMLAGIYPPWDGVVSQKSSGTWPIFCEGRAFVAKIVLAIFLRGKSQKVVLHTYDFW